MSARGIVARLAGACRSALGQLGEAAATTAAGTATASCSYQTISSAAARGVVRGAVYEARAQMGGVASSSASSSSSAAVRWYSDIPDHCVGLYNLRDNPGATKQARRGLHPLFDGGQLGLLKFPVSRQRPPYEVLYTQLGLSRIVEFVQLGLLDPCRTITIKDLYDSGCVTSNIKYGVLLYGKAVVTLPLDIQVTACDDTARACVERAGGRVVRTYYQKEGLHGILHPEQYTRKGLPLPLPAAGWHPKHNSRFDAVGQIPPKVSATPAAGLLAARALPPQPALAHVSA